MEVLAVASRALIHAAARLGLDVDAILAEVELPRERLAEPELRIPASQADAIWAAVARRLDDPDLALHVAEQLPFGAYRVIDYLAMHAPSLAHAIERVAAYFPLIDPRGRLVVERDADVLRLVMRSHAPGRLRREAAEYTFAALLLRLREARAIALVPHRVEFAAPPRPSDALTRIFACPLAFDRPEHALVIAAADAARESSRADPNLFDVLDSHAAQLLAARPPASPLLAGVREAIAAMMQRGEPVTLDAVGRRLAMSGRTLQRRLDAEQLRFAAIVDEQSAAWAKAALADSRLAICEVAFMLGFADQSAFTRAFKRWTGTTPGHWRADRGRAHPRTPPP